MACPVQDFNWKSLFGSKIVKHSLSSLIFKGKFYFFEYCVGLLHHNNGYHFDITYFQSNFTCLHGEHVYYTEGGSIIQCASQLIVALIKVMHDAYCKHLFACLCEHGCWTEVATLRQSLGGHLAFAKSAVKPRDSSEWVSSCELQKEECLKQ